MSDTSTFVNRCPKCGATLPSAATSGLCPRCLMAEAMAPTQPGAEPAEARQPLAPEELAPHFPQLEIIECLGRGGMGVVYKARQKSLNRFVALKLLAPERVREAKFEERFTREAQALAALNHPNIVTIYDFGQAGGFYYLLMEFVDGVNLRQLLRARKFTPEEALAIVPPLCDALQFAHDRGIVHRDIKPENLLLDKTGRVKVADFGIAKMIEPEAGLAGAPAGPDIGAAQQDGPSGVLGTPSYSAPEQGTDPGRVDSRADIYSLGVVFYEMLTGELPGKRLEPPSRKVHIDVRLDEVVLRALEQNPELRYQQVSEVKTMVETITRNPPVEARPGTDFAGSKGRFRILFVRVRNGKRVVNWSGAILIGFVLYAIILATLFIAFGHYVPLHDLCGFTTGLAVFITAILVQADLKQPRKQLTLLDATKERKRVAFVGLFAVVALLAVWWVTSRRHSDYGISYGDAGASLAAQHPEPNAVRELAGAPFVARVPDGGGIELLAVRLNPSTNQPWWQPDGTPSSYDSAIQMGPNNLGGGGVVALARAKYPKLPGLLPNRPGDTNGADMTIGFGGDRLYSAFKNGLPMTNDAPGTTFGVLVFQQALTVGNETTLPLKVAVGNWATIITVPKRGALASLFAGGARGEWSFSEDAVGAAKVTVDNLFRSPDTEYRIVAIDTNGREHLAPRWETTSGRNALYSKYTAVFASWPWEPSLLLKNLREARLQSRPYQQVEFRNVSLQPGHITTVEVKDFGDENPSETARPNLSFGPVMEHSLVFGTNGMTDSVGLQSNQIVKFPIFNARPPACITFTDDTESNAVYIQSRFGAMIRPVKSQDWNTLAAGRTVEMAAGTASLMNTAVVNKTDLPATCLFRADPGYVGLLQIVGSANKTNGLDFRYKLVLESSTNAVFPAEEDSQTSPPGGSKPIPPEAVKLFNQRSEIMLSEGAIGFEMTKSAFLERARLELQIEGIWREMKQLCQGTTAQESLGNWQRSLSGMQQTDPNDRGKWKQAREARQADEFNLQRLMVEAGAADFIQPQANKLRFGPWIEAAVLHPSAGTNCCIDFDTGRLLTPPPEILSAVPAMSKPATNIGDAMPEETGWYHFRSDTKETNAVARWIVENGVDAVGLAPRRLEMFCPAGIGTGLVDPSLNPDWDIQITPAWLLWELYYAGKSRAASTLLEHTAEALTFPDDSMTASNSLCFFRTRAGRTGVLQITGSTDNPPGVKIRYKLVQDQTVP